MLQKVKNFIFEGKKIKSTCACCGYKSLESNSDVGEICPLCFWENDFLDPEDLFETSSANYMTLYQAQENYKNYGCSKLKFLPKCKKLDIIEEKDNNFLSIQDKIEKKYNQYSELETEIRKICLELRQEDAKFTFYNLKRLDEIIAEGEDDSDRLRNQLLLRSLLIALGKNHYPDLNNLFIEYYNKGLSYYISWSTMLLVLTNMQKCKFGRETISILLDIENHNFYGLKSLEIMLKEYWHKHETI